MALTSVLYDLQSVDQEWDEKGRRYQWVAQRLHDTSELDAMRKAQSDRAKLLADTRGQLRDSELQLESMQQKLAQMESDLYGGRIRSPRELENLRVDAEHQRRHIGELEDRVLGLMADVEDLETAVKSGAEELQAFEAQWAATQQKLVEEYKELRARLQVLQARRDELRGRLGRSELALYDELRRTKGGMALSSVVDGICQACRVTVPSHKRHLLQTGETIVTCEGCGRILYPEQAALG